MTTTNALTPRPSDTVGVAAESLVTRGDWSGLSPLDRARVYIEVCEQHGLNPLSQPFTFLRLNGKEVLYATRGATDQLAAIHRINREIVDGPKVVDIGGTKVAYAVCRATHPNGRFETATATLPLVDPVNLYMKLETKAKRRATLSILGLGLLDETEMDTIPASAKGIADQADPVMVRAELTARSVTDHAALAGPTAGDVVAETPAMLGLFEEHVAEIELPGEAVAVWMKHRAELAVLSSADKEAAWQTLCRRLEQVGKMQNAKMWLKKSIAEEDARRGLHGDHPTVGGESTTRPPESAPAQDTTTSEIAPEPSSRSYATFERELAEARSLAAIHDAWAGLLFGLNEEGADLEHWTGGDQGAAAQARERMRGLGHRLSKAESGQVLVSKLLAELLDTQDVSPGPHALTIAARWWCDHKGDVKVLDPAHREMPWYALVRRYSGAGDAPAVKRAGTALTAEVKRLEGGPTPSGGGGSNGGGSGATAKGVGTSSTASSAPTALAEFRAHLRAVPGHDTGMGTGHVAGSYWKRRGDFVEEGCHAEALAAVLDELTDRGVEEPHSWLQEIGERNGAIERTRRAA